MENDIMTSKGFHSYIRTLYGNFCDLQTVESKETAAEKIVIHAPVNVMETENSYHLQIALPGYDKSEIRIRVEKEVLIIETHLHESKHDAILKFYKKEFFTSSFTRSFLLPDDVQAGKINAVFNNGVLSLELPKGISDPECAFEVDIHS